MILERQGGTRSPVHAGDVFSMKLPSGNYLYGRVVRTDACLRSFCENILIYLFDEIGNEVAPRFPLTVNRLLCGPIITNRQGWTRGFFTTIDSRPLGPDEELPIHCFLSSNGHYYDERNREVPPQEPTGEYSLQSYEAIDQAIQDALAAGRFRRRDTG